MPAPFHEIRFPLDIALRAGGGPQRRTDVVTLASNREYRNARWAHSRRRFDAGLGVRSLDALQAVIAFFEERRGRLYGFRFKDRSDSKSCLPSHTPSALDQRIGTGDGTISSFPLVKTYGAAFAPYARPIAKPVSGSVKVAVNGIEQTSGINIDTTTGLVVFAAAPAIAAVITAGFEFDVPVRFETDDLDIDFSVFEAGAVPNIPLIEIVV